MKNQHLGTVFAFTFTQHIKSKSYKGFTIGVFALCLLLPALIMAAMAYFGNNGGTQEATAGLALTDVYVVDKTPGTVNYASLNTLGAEGYAEIRYHAYGSDFDAALYDAEAAGGASLLLLVELDAEGRYALELLLPNSSTLTDTGAYSYESFLYGGFSTLMAEKADVSPALLSLPIELQVNSSVAVGMETEVAAAYSSTQTVLSMILPYLNIMLLYFLILFYGQGVAGSVVSEKSSKLMDTFLVSVRPSSMILGKILAIASAAILQLLLWIAALVASFAAGTAIVKAMGETLGIIALFEAIGSLGLAGMFTPMGIVLALLILIGGFLLYCALASVGGSLAGKQEDLSSTNMLFALALVVSFLCCIYQGALAGGAVTAWLNYVPFTAILVTPSQVLLGLIPLWQGLISLGIVLLSALLVAVFAAKIYQMMALYKGNPPSLRKAAAMLRGK